MVFSWLLEYKNIFLLHSKFHTSEYENKYSRCRQCVRVNGRVDVSVSVGKLQLNWVLFLNVLELKSFCYSGF